MERKRNSLSLEAFQIFIGIEGESIVYDFIAFAILQGNQGEKKKTTGLEFEDGYAFYIVSADWVLNCLMSKISTSVDVFAIPFSEFVVPYHKMFLSFL